MRLSLTKLLFLIAGIVFAVLGWVEMAERGGLTGMLLDGDQDVSVYEVPWVDGTRLVAHLRHCTDATVTVELNLTNLKSTTPATFTADVRGGRAVLAILKTVDTRLPTDLGYSYHWQLGGRQGGVDSQWVYRLPFQPEEKYQLAQGPGGKFSHQIGSNSAQAIDWSMPVGTPVLAARAGIVTAAFDGYSQAGTAPAFKTRGNHVVILHDDGTYAEYWHLMNGGAAVRLGQTVSEGEMIGYSGNTGYSTGPHLHFAVFRNIDGFVRETLPLHFRLPDGRIVDRFRKKDLY